ncbi:glycosyltransferase [Chitiniphilus eburneus]|uniref:Glycosyltransferase n=1 Tax=Chitiniphilus eburneus TaxID=2571148 RepID=A0A4U0Q870_9NEIS|nr:glycosyltransferase [Chitiniphilus eburneus]TJZ77439.1 glycosyltransferase [Chitiniphilus eburneus]
MTPKKILLLDTGNEWGGGTNSMFELLKRIDRQRFAVTCAFYHDYPRGDSSLSRDLAAIGIPLTLLPQRRQPAWAKLAKELVRGVLTPWPARRARAVRGIDAIWRTRPNAARIGALLRQGDFDLLYMNNQPLSNIEGYRAAEAAGVPTVQHCRIEPVLDAPTVALVNRLAKKVIGVSYGVVRTLTAQGVDERRCVAVLNGIDPTQPLPDGAPLRATLGIPDDAVVFGTVGSLIARKSNHHVLEALARARLPGDWRLILVGEGREREALQQQAVQLGLADKVIFAGFQREPLPWVAAMDVCILASSSEGLPRVVLEAMLLSKPVIGSAVVGTRELIVDGETGLLYPYGDVATLTAHLHPLAANAALRRTLGERGHARVCAHYTVQRYVCEVEAVLAEAARP